MSTTPTNCYHCGRVITQGSLCARCWAKLNEATPAGAPHETPPPRPTLRRAVRGNRGGGRDGVTPRVSDRLATRIKQHRKLYDTND